MSTINEQPIRSSQYQYQYQSPVPALLAEAFAKASTSTSINLALTKGYIEGEVSSQCQYVVHIKFLIRR